MMQKRRLPGMTLPELLTAISILACIFITVCTTMLQLGRIHARTYAHFQAQSSEQLAFRRMQNDLRDPVSVSTSSSASMIEVVRPLKDNGLNKISYSTSAAGNLALSSGKTVRFFLGKKQTSGTSWNAVPDANGDTIFRVESAAAGSPITPANGPFLSSSVEVIMSPRWDMDRECWVEGIYPNPPNPLLPGSTTPEPLFAYDSVNQLLRITITTKVADASRAGRPLVSQTFRTQFYLRNIVR